MGTNLTPPHANQIAIFGNESLLENHQPCSQTGKVAIGLTVPPDEVQSKVTSPVALGSANHPNHFLC